MLYKFENEQEAEEYLETIANIGAFPESDDAQLCVSGLCNSENGTARWTQNYGYFDWNLSGRH